MAYTAAAIANYFLEKAKRDGTSLDPMKIQKLVYFAHGWNLALRNEPLIKERIEAWEYGPVIPPLYHQFKHFGNGPITEPAVNYQLDGGKVCYRIASLNDEGESDSNQIAGQLLDRVWDVYKDFNAIQLSNMTHVDGSPWQLAWSRNPGKKGVVIDDDLIKADFERKAEN
jgi:uncharacterized phage-associated protein